MLFIPNIFYSFKHIYCNVVTYATGLFRYKRSKIFLISKGEMFQDNIIELKCRNEDDVGY